MMLMIICHKLSVGRSYCLRQGCRANLPSLTFSWCDFCKPCSPGFEINDQLWVWDAIKWVEFANPLTSMVRCSRAAQEFKVGNKVFGR